MRCKTLLLSTFLIVFINCSSESDSPPEPTSGNPPASEEPAPPDNPEPEEEEPKDPVFDVSAIYKSNGNVYQANINSDTEEIVEFNLTNELGIDNLQIENSTIQDESIFFFSWYFEKSRVFMKDLETNLVYSNSDFCEFIPEPDVVNEILLTSGNTDFLFYVYRKILPNAYEYHIDIFDVNSSECKTVLFHEPDNLQSQFNYALNGEFLALSYLYGDDFPKTRFFVLIDLTSGEIVKSLEYESTEIFSSTLEENKFYVFHRDFTYEIYDIANDVFSERMNSKNFRFYTSHAQGQLFTTTFLGNKMVTKVELAQPASHIFAPAIYDLELDEIIGGVDFLLRLENKIFETTGELVSFGEFDVDIESSSLAIGYNDRKDGTGGVVFLNFDLEIYKTVILEFTPLQVVLRDIK
ncbi:hypothetical protein [Flagellimonas sp. 2504JD1-5]